MRLVVGLGNPGREYEATRHNLGFMLIDRLFERAGERRFRDEAGAKVAEIAMAGHRVALAKPQTFMNLSGDAVRPLLEHYGEGDPANLIVAVDDVALPFGMIRVRPRGSASHWCAIPQRTWLASFATRERRRPAFIPDAMHSPARSPFCFPDKAVSIPA